MNIPWSELTTAVIELAVICAAIYYKKPKMLMRMLVRRLGADVPKALK